MLENVAVRGHQLIDQLRLQRLLAEPDVTRRHRVDIHTRPVLAHVLFEQTMRVLQVFAKLFAAFVGVFAEQCQRALVFTRGNQLKVDIVFLEQTVKVG